MKDFTQRQLKPSAKCMVPNLPTLGSEKDDSNESPGARKTF